MAAGPRARGARGRRQWAGARASRASAGLSPAPRPRLRAPAGVAGLGLGPGAQLGRPLSLPRARTAGGAGAGLLDHSAPGDAATWGRERRAGNVSDRAGGSGRPGGGPSGTSVPRRGRKPKWVCRAGEKLRCDQSQQAPPERPVRHGHPVALLPRPSPANPSPYFPHPESGDHHPLAPTLAFPSPTVALAGTFRDLLAAEASLEPCPSGCSAAPRTWQASKAAENLLRLLGNCNRFVMHFR